MAPKETIWYTVRVTNKGPSYARNVLISDSVPSQLADVSWNARPSSGASILSGETGNGNQVETRADIPPGASVIVTISGTVLPGTSGEVLTDRKSTRLNSSH